MRKTRLFAALTAGAMLAISGCGTTEDAASNDASADTGSGESITIVDARGKEVVLDRPATRVAGSEWGVVENMVSLGIMPVGAADIEGYETWVSSAPLDDTVTDIGTRGEPSIDTLVALEPDLLLVTDSLVDGAIEQIEETIPVIVVPGGDAADSIGQMFATMDIIAQATGTEEAAAEVKATFEAKVEEGRAAVEAAGATGDVVAFSDSYVDAGSVSIRPYAEGSLVSDVFAEIGLENAWSMEGDPAYGLAQTDVEGLTELGDAHFWYMANDSLGDPYTNELADNAIWMDLPFVNEDKVVRFPDSIWTFGGPTSMEQIIDAAVDALN